MPRVRITDDFALVTRKGSKNWYLEYREDGKAVRRPTGTSDFEQAKLAARDIILERIGLKDVKPTDIRVIDVIDRYYLQHGRTLPSKATAKRAKAIWAEFWGDATVADVTPPKQREFVAHMKEAKLSQGYIRRVLGVGQSALNRACQDGEILRVPFIKLPPISEAYPHVATRAQLVALLNACPAHVFTYCLIRLTTVCRGDAALDLQPFQVDFDHGLIRLNPEGREQTKKRRPVVPLTETLRAHLSTLKPKSHYVNWHGNKVVSIKTTWRKLRTKLKLPTWFVPKVLRHTAATHLRQAGVPGWEVSGFLGHTGGDSAKTTEIYAKFDPKYLGKARKELDAWMRDLAKDVPRLRQVQPSKLRVVK